MGKTHEECAAAVESMVLRFGQDVYRLCRVYLQDASLAQDAAQETFLKAFRHYGSFRHEASEKTWLMTICVRTCKNMLRSPWHRWVDRTKTPEDMQIAWEETESNQVLRAVLMLPESLRMTVVLHYYYGFKAREIGDMLHLPLGTVLSRLRRGREKLSQMLSEGGDEDG